MAKFKDISLSLNSIFIKDRDKSFSIDFYKGSLNIILGPENSGKSILCRKIAGIDNTVGGEIKYFDKTLNQIKNQNLILYFPSTNIFFENRTVIDNLIILSELSSIPLNCIEKRIKKISPVYGLKPIKNIKLINLPKSIKSILILSLIEIIMPEIVVISSQDFYGDQLREDFFYKRLYYLKNLGYTFVISSQRFGYINYCDSIILLVDNKPVFAGNLNNLSNIDNPKDIELILLKKIEENYERIKID
ncbi:MAG: ATP-binding cassette domain-containing protein [Exilispira sp.]